MNVVFHWDLLTTCEKVKCEIHNKDVDGGKGNCPSQSFHLWVAPSCG